MRRVHAFEERRQSVQRDVDHRPQRPQRMVRRYALFRRDVTDQAGLLSILTPHHPPPCIARRAGISYLNRRFEATFSAPC